MKLAVFELLFVIYDLYVSLIRAYTPRSQVLIQINFWINLTIRNNEVIHSILFIRYYFGWKLLRTFVLKPLKMFIQWNEVTPLVSLLMRNILLLLLGMFYFFKLVSLLLANSNVYECWIKHTRNCVKINRIYFVCWNPLCR